MCGECVKSKCPDRGNTCLDNGSYILNFDHCAECQKREPIKITQRNVEVKDDGEEVISYEHKCTYCCHLIAEHEHTFTIEGEYQEYAMYCLLCGVGNDTISVQPVDPRKETALF
ncbi:protein Churchill-like [Lytechinus variegatus]|uniref:protein Churchill-like n=1 Tax=Lytechinus variegatus TaxID=7654 RepID=UPI001BB2720A|nr:protein Churchill-like [Lytechinus variegatus]